MIRKSALGVIAFLLACILVVVLLFRNGIVEGLAERALSSTLGSQVDIDGFILNPFTLEAGFERMQITDKKDPWRNRLDVGQARFDVDGMQLFAQRLIVDELFVTDVAVDTERSERAQFRPKSVESNGDHSTSSSKNSGDEAGWSKLTDSLPKLDLSALLGDIDTKSLMGGRELGAAKRLESAQQKAQQLADERDARLETSDFEKRAAALKQRYQTLQKQDKPKSLEAIKSYAKELKSIQNDFKELRGDVKETLAASQRDLKYMRNWVPDLEQEISADVAGIRQLANIVDLEVEQVAEIIFGEAAVHYLRQAMQYIDLMQGLSGSTEEQPKPPRRAGRDIHFPTTGERLPKMVIRHALLERKQQADHWGYQIDAKGISSDATIYANPTQISAVFGHAHAGQWQVFGTLDHRTKNSVDHFKIAGRSLNPGQMRLGDGSGSMPTAFIPQQATVDGVINIEMGSIAANIQFKSTRVEFVFSQDSGKKAPNDRVKQIFNDIRDVSFDVQITGGAGDVKLKARSNIDSIISRRMKAMLGQRIKQVEQQIRSDIEGQIKSQRTQLDDQVSARRATMQQRIDQYRSQVQAVINEVEKQHQAAETRLKGKLF